MGPDGESIDWDDRYNIKRYAYMADAEEMTAERWQHYEPRMRRLVRRSVQQHRDAIQRVAVALLKHQKLSPEEVDALISSPAQRLNERRVTGT